MAYNRIVFIKNNFIAFIKEEERGAVSVEFSLIATLLLIIIFLILNFSLVFLGKQIMADAVDETVRDIKINSRKGVKYSENYIRSEICDRISQIFNVDCPAVGVDLKGYRDATVAAKDALPAVDNMRVRDVSSQKITRVVINYQWPTVFGIVGDNWTATQLFWSSYEVRVWVNE